MIYVIDKKQMHDSVITGKVYTSKDWEFYCCPKNDLCYW